MIWSVRPTSSPVAPLSGGRRCAAAKRWIYTRDRERARVVSCQGISLDEMAIGTSPEIEGKIMNKCETDLHFSILREINEAMMQTFNSAAARRTWFSMEGRRETKTTLYSMLFFYHLFHLVTFRGIFLLITDGCCEILLKRRMDAKTDSSIDSLCRNWK